MSDKEAWPSCLALIPPQSRKSSSNTCVMSIAQLPANSDVDHITAEIENGELTVRVPRCANCGEDDQPGDVQ